MCVRRETQTGRWVGRGLCRKMAPATAALVLVRLGSPSVGFCKNPAESARTQQNLGCRGGRAAAAGPRRPAERSSSKPEGQTIVARWQIDEWENRDGGRRFKGWGWWGWGDLYFFEWRGYGGGERGSDLNPRSPSESSCRPGRRVVGAGRAAQQQQVSG
jgi:hypothetical protein